MSVKCLQISFSFIYSSIYYLYSLFKSTVSDKRQYKSFKRTKNKRQGFYENIFTSFLTEVQTPTLIFHANLTCLKFALVCQSRN